jgi:Uncharacterized proteins, homologs of microcin C7 resistance protein MccF
VEENMSHIDRLVNTLILNGVFDRCKGVILGEFTGCDANLEFDSVEQMLCSYLKDYHIPVCCGFPAGHDAVNLPLVMGAQVSLSVGESGSRIRFLMEGMQKPVHASMADTLTQNTSVSVSLQESKAPGIVRAFNFAKYYNGVKKLNTKDEAPLQ